MAPRFWKRLSFFAAVLLGFAIFAPTVGAEIQTTPDLPTLVSGATESSSAAASEATGTATILVPADETGGKILLLGLAAWGVLMAGTAVVILLVVRHKKKLERAAGANTAGQIQKRNRRYSAQHYRRY